MSDVLEDLSTANLITAIEENWFSVFSAFRKWPQAAVHDTTEIKWSMTDVPFPLFNSIVRAQLSPDRIDGTIHSLITQAESRGVPLLWWTGPATQPADLGAHLKRHGFVSTGPIPGMAVDLRDLRERLPAPTGLAVQVVKDRETLKLWSQVFAIGFGLPEFVAEAFYDLMGYVDSETTIAYLGRLNDKPVATSLLWLAAGVAGIYSVATIPEARRQGIGALMTALPLRDARMRGYQAGILHASKKGAGVYRSLGFQEYCPIGQYVWSSDHTLGAG